MQTSMLGFALQLHHPAAYLTRTVGLKPLMAEALVALHNCHHHHRQHPNHGTIFKFLAHDRISFTTISLLHYPSTRSCSQLTVTLI